MPRNDFNKDELVSMRGKSYPVVGGRLRLAHEEGLSGIATEVIDFAAREHASVRATAFFGESGFTGTGYADSKRDGRLSDALLELAETRAIARALRFAGFGVEFTGAEEMSHVGKADKAPAPTRSGDTLDKGGSDPVTPAQAKVLRELAAKLRDATGEPVDIPVPQTSAMANELIAQLNADLTAKTGKLQ